MRIALGVVFAILLALELSLVVAVVILLIDGALVGWERSPVTTVLAGVALALAGVGLYRSARVRLPAFPGGTEVHSGINFSRVPVSGAGGAIFMLQFVIWVVLAPEVGLLYAVLIAGGVALLPVAFYVNRRHGRGLASVGLGTVLGAVAALVWVSLISFRHTPLAWILPIAVPAGVLRRRAVGVEAFRRQAREHRSVREVDSGLQDVSDAAQQADEADEARGEVGRSMVLGAFRGWVRIVRGGASSRASQLIRGVRRTPEGARGRTSD